MEEKIISLIADKLGKDAKTIKLESKLVEDLGADSLDVIELIMAFEDEFGISLPDEEISKMKTIADVVNYIKSLKK
ncbi:MAG: acyl carrier protein [Clostridia bacterium]|nr:acyl carrier protein [Clostridia bacterium]